MTARDEARAKVVAQVERAFDALWEHEIVAFVEMLTRVLDGILMFRNLRGMVLEDVNLKDEQ